MSLPERDWKYLRSIEKELLDTLCKNINQKADEILSRAGFENEHARYLVLYQHIEASDEIVANCFNDWRRSNIRFKLLLLGRQNVLTEEQINDLSDEARNVIAKS